MDRLDSNSERTHDHTHTAPASNGPPDPPHAPPPVESVAGIDWPTIKRLADLKLCPQEFRVAQGIFQGTKFATIATQMGLQPTTIEEYWKRARHNNGIADIRTFIHRIYATVIRHIVDEADKELQAAGRQAQQDIESLKARIEELEKSIGGGKSP